MSFQVRPLGLRGVVRRGVRSRCRRPGGGDPVARGPSAPGARPRAAHRDRLGGCEGRGARRRCSCGILRGTTAGGRGRIASGITCSTSPGATSDGSENRDRPARLRATQETRRSARSG
ncbi:hypothetical protein FM110_10540 [Brachybacterium nesterenkovii]|uniref:Uncharacterized protein n=1 Tax=Brachybacterium nesterenkovii TaxID=47847 RepID=A0A1X6X4R7_9MICO|nr:hypothetical protein FM110_10540 [Brachybacterium nesterenkovii]